MRIRLPVCRFCVASCVTTDRSLIWHVCHKVEAFVQRLHANGVSSTFLIQLHAAICSAIHCEIERFIPFDIMSCSVIVLKTFEFNLYGSRLLRRVEGLRRHAANQHHGTLLCWLYEMECKTMTLMNQHQYAEFWLPHNSIKPKVLTHWHEFLWQYMESTINLVPKHFGGKTTCVSCA